MPVFTFGRDKIEDFIRLARDIVKFEVNILCEGIDDIDVLTALIDKMGIQISRNVRLNDCGGTSELQKLASMMATLARLSKRLKRIVLIVDADSFAPQERAQSLRQSLNSHEVETEELGAVSGSIYRTESERLDFLIKIVGKMDLSFQRHEMEDYAVDLLIIKGEVEESELTNFQKPSDFLEHYGNKADTIIRESQEEEVKQAYENVINLLTML